MLRAVASGGRNQLTMRLNPSFEQRTHTGSRGSLKLSMFGEIQVSFTPLVYCESVPANRSFSSCAERMLVRVAGTTRGVSHGAASVLAARAGAAPVAECSASAKAARVVLTRVRTEFAATAPDGRRK